MSESQAPSPQTPSDPPAEGTERTPKRDGRIPPPQDEEHVVWRKWCIGVGALMMLLSLSLSVLIPVQENMLYVTNRAFMALGGGLVAGGLLGLLHIEVKLLKQTVTAGGGLGVFVLLFLVNPPALTANLAAPAGRKAALNAIVRVASPEAKQMQGIRPMASLDALLEEMGFRSFRHFRVTATDEQIDALNHRIRDLGIGR